ncbi:class I SAM-dependent methyltransferase [Kamptonema formosum]|uniref:class I SAM-dependent methyltransferase n=1 Tax=Kamptonema formosum TaxID=331992 RepID=UPI000345ABC6|nr:class I SAM-dependent methyltransferase [Oscillatoria sp. PCC 10802]
MEKDKVQTIQEDQYIFPYHYIPQSQKDFTQCYNFRWGINYAASLEFMIERVKREPVRSIADVGCGDGRLTKELKEALADKEVVGIDYSERAIALARLMYPQGTYYCLDITRERVENKFDLAILMEVFEHIPPAAGEEFLAGVADLMVKDGILLLTVPHLNAPVEPKHYRHFSLETLSKCLEKNFEIAEVIFLEKNDGRKKLIDRLLTNRLFILNNGRLKNLIYKYYKQKLFIAERESECRRIFIKARVKSG